MPSITAASKSSSSPLMNRLRLVGVPTRTLQAEFKSIAIFAVAFPKAIGACLADLELSEQQGPALAQLNALCEPHRHSPFVKLDEFRREMLIDCEAIIRPLHDPSLPGSNNAAEQGLRHWVISRTIGHGTGSEDESRAYVGLGSLIETGRRRGASAWRYRGTVIAAARKGCGSPRLRHAGKRVGECRGAAGGAHRRKAFNVLSLLLTR